jgi:2-keto-4-pentenoate hydratase/2-oxohepta-3-ene-1,7-dioic acid hydratase in catechol pathway
VKLCRFELISSPTHPRSGIVYGSKVYETDGSNPIGTYEWSEVRLLAPVGMPPSVRLFHASDEESDWSLAEENPLPNFQYLNPRSMIGPGLTLPVAERVTRLEATPCIGIIIAGAGRNVSPEDADGLILGLCLVTSFLTPNDQGARSRDIGFVLGPAVTTPDELDDAVTVDERGRRYRFGASLKVNSEELMSFDLSDLPRTPAELLSFASESATLQQGDVVAIALGPASKPLEKGDQVQVACEKLGVLTTRIA